MTKWWPSLALLSVSLIESRSFVTTPSMYEHPELQKHPDDATVQLVHDNVSGIVVGTGVTFLGLAAMVVFVVVFAAWIHRAGGGLVAPGVMVAGAASTGAAVLVGFGVSLTMAAASEEGSAATVAAVYIIADSLGYIGWTAFGLVTGAVFAARRTAGLPAWIGWFSLAVTVLYVLFAFAPYLSWAPGLLWLVVVGLGLLLAPATRENSAVSVGAQTSTDD